MRQLIKQNSQKLINKTYRFRNTTLYPFFESSKINVLVNNLLKFKTSFIGKCKIIKKFVIKKSFSQTLQNIFKTNNDMKLAKEYILQNHIYPDTLGNSEYLTSTLSNNYDYFHDLTISIKDYIKTHNLKENKTILREYVNNIYECWGWGFADRNYNFESNCGVNDNSKVVLSNFWELEFDKYIIKKQIKDKYWIKHKSYKNLPEKLKPYFRRLMKRKITCKKLDELWCLKLINRTNDLIESVKESKN